MNLLISVPSRLGRASLRNTKLDNADLSNANLVEAKLQNASLRGTLLSHASLHGANLSGANLTYTNFYSADLSFSVLIDIQNDIQDGQKYNFICKKANFRNAVINDVELEEYLKKNDAKNIPTTIS